MRFIGCVLVLGAAVLSAAAQTSLPAASGGRARLAPKAPITAGPVVFYVVPSSLMDKMNTLYVADPALVDKDSTPGTFRLARTLGEIEILERLGPRYFIATYNDGPSRELWTLDLGTGEIRDLAEGNLLRYLGVFGARVYWSVGFDIYSRSLNERGPAAPFPEKVDKVLSITNDGIIYIDRAPMQAIKIADLDGTNARTISMLTDEQRKYFGFTVEVSPNRTRIAIIDWSEASRHCITVVDVASGRPLAAIERINIEVSPLSSMLPRVEMTWLDEDHLRFSETQSDGVDPAGTARGRFVFVDYDVTKKARIAEKSYGPIGLHHVRPPVKFETAGGKKDIGAFTQDGRKLARRDVADPLLEIADAPALGWPWIIFAPDGGAALTFADRDGRKALVLVRARGGVVSEIGSSPVRLARWF